jgi:hypothetical protein
VQPDKSTNYVLTAKNASGEVTATVTVRVVQLPRIVLFTASPPEITSGASVTLLWKVTGADTGTLKDLQTGVTWPLSAEQIANGTKVLSPTQGTSYLLTAKNQFGEVTATVSVEVKAGQTPEIVYFTSNVPEIVSGDPATLRWKVTGADSGTLKDLRTGQPWPPLNAAQIADGTQVVRPSQGTNYLLTAKNRFGEVTATVSVEVTCPAPRIWQFLATPEVIPLGQTALLSWQVTDATSVTISGIPGSLELSGTRTVPPLVTTKYTLTATSSCGSVSQTVQVTVTAPATPVKIKVFTANPIRTEQAGRPVTLHWETENALQVVITGVPGPLLPVDNGSVVVNPQADTVYTLIAYGERSEADATIQVRVGSNSAPVAAAGPDQMGLHTPTVRLNAFNNGDGPLGRGSYDPDNDPITCHWEVLGPPYSYPLTIDQPEAEFRFSLAGIYTFRLTVTDDRRASSSDTVRVEYLGP